MTRITDTIINKLDEFFQVQIQKKVVKNINSKAIALMCYSIIFHSVILCQIYENDDDDETNSFADEYLNILFNGIKA